jgi:hypothetical protein
MKTEETSQASSRAKPGQKYIYLAFANASEYARLIEQPTAYRHYIIAAVKKHPELFPEGMAEGFRFHDSYHSKKQQIRLRRIKVKSSGEVFTLHPTFVMPYMIARTDEVEKALYLRHWGVPFAALSYVFGRDAMFWYRAWLAFGRPALVGTTVKAAARLPSHLAADEKFTWLQGEEVYVPVTVGAQCVLGVSLVTTADGAQLTAAYGEFADEAHQLEATYAPQTVCLDGWKATQQAWQTLFPALQVILCFLHSVLALKERCHGPLRKEVLRRAWHIFGAKTKAHFSQRCRRFSEWATDKLSGAVAVAAQKLCLRRQRFTQAFAFPGAYRTSNPVDRILDHFDRILYAMRYFHGDKTTAKWALRAIALHYNFHPYGPRLRHDQPERLSPFADLNGFHYHPNWLHNFLLASSMGGLPSHHKFR